MIARVVLLLALGSACAIGVAVAGSVWKEAPSSYAASLLAERSQPGDEGAPDTARIPTQDSWGASDRGLVVVLESSLIEADVQAALAAPENFAKAPNGREWFFLAHTWMHHRAGWPALCLQGWSLRGDDRNVSLWAPPLGSDRARSMYMIEKRKDRRGIPLAPIWSGFLINTLFYAAVLWLLFTTPARIRRMLRRRRGLCPACAYPTGESDTCSECGAPRAGRNAG